MTPAKRRPATPASAARTKASTKDSRKNAPTEEAGDDSAAPAETGQVGPDDRATKPPMLGPTRALHPERIWPD